MLRYEFDIETNGLEDASTVHCLVIKNPDTGIRLSYADQPGYGPISDGLAVLADADVLIGHNIIKYDLPTLKRIRGFEPKPGCLIRDTLVCTRLIWTDLANEDFRRRDRGGQLPATLIGSHSLKAWGYRLGVLKGLFNETASWDKWTPEMHAYCEQDVEVTHALWRHIENQRYAEEAIQLEHDFQEVIFLQERHGFRFDEAAAGKLHAELVARKEALTAELQKLVPPTRIEMKTPEYWTASHEFGEFERSETKTGLVGKIKARGGRARDYHIEAGPNKVKVDHFNPGSRQQVAAYLTGKGWTPAKFTDTGQPQIDETVLEGIDFPEAKLLKEYFIVGKLLGQLAEGDNAWLKHTRKGRLHGQMNTNGAVTGRCSHYKPNVGQVPSVMVGKDKKPLLGYEGRFGWECRSLFLADDGKVLVGADASGLELRNLAHYMARYDGGAYGKIVTEGDVHTVNQQAAGIASRAEAKTFIYSYLYGAGDEKLGINCGGVTPADITKYKAEQRDLWAEKLRVLRKQAAKDPKIKVTEERIALCVKGALIREQFQAKTPALARLLEAVAEAVRTRGYLIGLDGRRLHVRSAHAALNTLLQSAGAILVKKWTVILYKKLVALGWQFGREWAQVAHIHDEIEASVLPNLAQQYGELAIQSLREAGEHFKFRCPLAGEFKVGSSWAVCH
jgi:DNA polymerase-1